MKVAKHNVFAACLSVLSALAALFVFFKSFDGFYVWAAPSLPFTSSLVLGHPLRAAARAQALDIPVLLFPDDDTATNDSSVVFGWSDVGAPTYTLKVDATEVTVTDTSKVLDLADGAHSWTVQAVDAFGVPSGYADPWTVTVDTLPPPQPTLLSPEDGAASDSEDIRFSWSSVEGAAFYNLRVDEVPHSVVTTSMLFSGLEEGVHEWAVQAVDQVGNASSYADERTVTVDTVDPTVTIDAPLDGAVLTTTHLYTVTVQGTALDVGTDVDRVEVDTGAGWKPASGAENWTYGWALPTVDQELWDVRVRAFDKAGNESLQSQIALVLDTVAPTAQPPLPDPPREWVTQTVVYAWSPSVDQSGIERYRIHIYNMQDYSETVDVEDTSYVFAGATQEGEGYFARVQALDGRGNWGPWSGFSTVVPDLTPPTIVSPYLVIDGPYLHEAGTTLYYINTMSLPQSFEARGDADDALSGVDRVCFSPAFGDQPSCDVDGFQPWQSIDPRYAVDGGTVESGVIEATVYDLAGNTARQTYAYELDETSPESTASSPDYATTRPIRVDWTAGDTQSGVQSVELWYKYEMTGTWTYVQTRLAGADSFEFLPPDGPGTYTFGTVAVDHVGNREGGVTEPDAETLYDTSTPTSEVTWAPFYWNKPSVPITMTWVATPSLPGNPVTEVRLWYRYGAGEWNLTARAGAGTSGNFEFDLSTDTEPLTGDGAYEFETVARDASDKSEALPSGSSGDRTVYDTEIGAPDNLVCLPSDWSPVLPLTVRWTNPDDLAGIAAAYYKVGAAPTGPHDGMRLEGLDLSQIEVTGLPGQGEHTVWVWLEDRAGNIGNALARDTVCKYDASVGASSGLAAFPSGWTTTDAFTVTWSNPSDLSGISGAYWKLDSSPTDPEDGTWWPGADLDRISDISVSDEGMHTLYLWLYDAAGNIGVSERQTVSLFYDPTPPTDVLISTPISITKASFDVYWTADAAASGLLLYAVEYSGVTDFAWQPWLTATTAISGLFTAPLADTEYAFRVTARDRAGNIAQAQTAAYLPPQRVYLPIFSDRWAEWYLYDTYEPNDTWQDAYGPLKIGQVYESSIWNEQDVNDWYHLTILSPSRVQVLLEGIPKNKDYDLYVYDHNKGFPLYVSDRYDSTDEEIRFWPTPGLKYWIRVLSYQGPKPPPPPNNYSQEPYRLTVSTIK